MADKKISGLVSLAGVDLSDADLIPVVDVSTAEAKAVSISGIKTALAATFPAYSAVSPIIDAFSLSPGKNLYDKSNAVDGVILSYGSGINQAYANGISLGKIPVKAGKTYTVSMGSVGFNSSLAMFCWNAASGYLGIDHTIGATAGMASPPTNITWAGLSQVTFTIPVGSLIAFVSIAVAYSVHNTTDFNTTISTVQAEEGTISTNYAAYSILQSASLDEIDGKLYSDRAKHSALSVTKLGDDLYIRGRFDATKDIIQKMTLATGVAFTNDVINIVGARTTWASIANTKTAWDFGSDLAASSDDVAPLNYNGTYIGANHGPFIAKEIAATAHGKTVQDVGSEWTDGAAVKWYLMRIVDANKLWVVSQNNSTYPDWSFTSAITGSTLTHSAGATHTGSITVASYITSGLFPCLQNQSKKVLLNGKTEISADGVYACDSVDVVNSYSIVNPAAVLTYVRSLVGGSTQPSFIDTSIAADINRTITYKYAENCSCTVIDGIHNINALTTLGYYGAVQAYPLAVGSKQLWQYIPRVLPKVGGIKTWDFKAQENISGTFEQLTFGIADVEDANNLPDRMAQIIKTAGVNEFGFMLGYSPVRSVGVPALRKTLCTTPFFISAAKKQYPEAINGGTLAANSYFEIVAFRAYWSASANTDATCFTWYRDGKNVIVVADFHKNVSMSKLTLPSKFTGMDVEVIDKTASATLHGNGVVTPGGILVSVSGGYGYVVLKLS